MKKKREKASEQTPSGDESADSELEMPIWSVVTFERCAASGLKYDEATAELEKLRAEKVSGLCIVTDETAARMGETKEDK